MIIIFWLFLIFSPVLWLISLVLLLIKKRPLTFLLNFVACAVIIYLLWAGIDPGAERPGSSEMFDDMGDTLGGIMEGMAKGSCPKP